MTQSRESEQGSQPGNDWLGNIKSKPTDAMSEMSSLPVKAQPAFREVAGTELCKRLIFIIAWVIAIVLLATFYSENRNSSRASVAEERVVRSIASLTANPVTPASIDSMGTSLKRLSTLLNTKGSTEYELAEMRVELRRLRYLIGKLCEMEEVTYEKEYWLSKAELLKRAEISFAQFRKLPKDTFENIGLMLKAKAEKLPVGGIEHDRLAGAKDLLQSIESTRETERKQIFALAQLILINVLLPLLTAMFGYIFGVGQASSQESKAEV